MRTHTQAAFMWIGIAVLATALVGATPAGAAPPTAPGSESCGMASQALPTTGTVVTDAGGLSLFIPAPGLGVIENASLKTGSQSLGLSRGLDGSLTVLNCGDDSSVASPSSGDATTLIAASSPTACSDSFYSLLGFEWHHYFHWSYEAASTPSNLTTSQAETAIENGRQAITQLHNDCGLSGFVGANFGEVYDGHITGGNNVTSSGGCAASGSGTSVANFQSMPVSDLGVTCTYVTGTSPTESDVSFNKNATTWFVGSPPAGCSNKWSLRATATHESGHTYGLDDVSESSHGNLTMSELSNGACQDSEYTLGKGDVLGVEQVAGG